MTQAARIREVAATVPKVNKPAFALSDERAVILRTRLPGGLVEIRFEGGGPGFREKQIERLWQYLEIMLCAEREEYELPNVLTAAKGHDPEPVALDEGIR